MLKELRIALAVFAALAAAALCVNAPSGQAASKCAAHREGDEVGEVIKVLHSSVYVGGKYVSAAPSPIDVDDRICTDARGEVVFAVVRADSRTTCNALSGSILVAGLRALTIDDGSAWCVARGGTAVLRALDLKLQASRDTLFNVVVDRDTLAIKVVSGSLSLSGSTGMRRLVSKGRQLTDSNVGTRLVLTARDRVAIAELGAAIATR